MMKKKWLIGIVSLLTVIVLIVVAAWNTGGNDKSVASKKSNEAVSDGNIENQNDLADEEEKDKLGEKNGESSDVKDEKRSESDKKGEGKKEDKVEDKKETVTQKEDGTKTTVKQSTGSTPTATVKVEKSSGEKKVATSKNTSSSTSSLSNNNPTSKPKESKPNDTVTTKTTTATESIGFKTVRENDSSLAKGKEVVSQNGQNGSKTITYKETYTNGKLTSKNQVSSKVTKNPVDKVIKVGTKVPQPDKPTYQSASQAHSILAGSGMSKAGSTYSLSAGSMGTDVTVTVGGNHVTNITFNADSYIPWKYGTLQELQEILGAKEGKEVYDFAQSQAAKIEKSVRAATNAVYGSGTSQANSLYDQIIKSEGTSKSF